MPTDRLKNSLARCCGQWTCLSDFFKAAGRNERIGVPVMPILSYVALIGGQVLSLPSSAELVASSPLVSGSVAARCYQFWTAWLRELACGLYLSDHGDVFKNPRMDISDGVDWLFRRNGREVKIAVAHEGRTSAAYFSRRKSYKLAEGTHVLTARAGDGFDLDLVSKIDMDAMIRAMSA